MANTAIAKGNALTQKLWSSVLFKEAGKQFFFKKFTGESENSIIQVKNDLTKDKGDKINIGLIMDMSGDGQSSQTATTIEGNEEALSLYDFGVELTEYSHGVRADGKLTMRRTAFDMRKTMKNALAKWLKNRMENLLITALSTSPTTNRGINITSGQPASGEVLSTALISQAKRLAQLSSPKVLPVNVDGKDYYVLLAHPYQTKALKVESAWVNAQRNAGPRSLDNPIFSGMLGIWDGVVIHEYDRVVLSTGSEARALLLGAQAGVIAWGQLPAWYEKDFDYYRIPGVATDFIAGFYKTVFNSEDFATITLDTLYTADS